MTAIQGEKRVVFLLRDSFPSCHTENDRVKRVFSWSFHGHINSISYSGSYLFFRIVEQQLITRRYQSLETILSCNL